MANIGARRRAALVRRMQRIRRGLRNLEAAQGRANDNIRDNTDGLATNDTNTRVNRDKLIEHEGRLDVLEGG